MAAHSAEVYARIEPALEQLEQERRGVVNRLLLSVLIAVPCVGGGAYLLFREMDNVVLAIALLAIGVIGIIIATRGPVRRFRATFKERVMGPLVQSVGEGLSFHAAGSISESEFMACGLFQQSPDRYHGEDLVQGKSGVTAFRFSEVHAEYRTESTDSKGNPRTEWHDIFRGVFFVADFNKSFQGTTHVVPDAAERWLGQLGKTLQSWGSALSSLKLVRLEDPDFEKVFKVMASDQVEARYILSTSLMRRVLDFQGKTGLAISLSFHNESVYVAIPSHENRFEPPFLFVPVSRSLKPEHVERHLADLRLFISIVDELDLNTRVWSKGAGQAPRS
jgi:hypothetical protein